MRVDSVLGSMLFDLVTMPVGTRADALVCSCADCVVHAAWRGCSDVLYLGRLVVDSAHVVMVLQAYPGAAVCATLTQRDRLIVAVRWREQIQVLCGDADVAQGVDALPVFGSAVHASLAAGISPRALTGLALGDGPPIRLRLREVGLAFES